MWPVIYFMNFPAKPLGFIKFRRLRLLVLDTVLPPFQNTREKFAHIAIRSTLEQTRHQCLAN